MLAGLEEAEYYGAVSMAKWVLDNKEKIQSLKDGEWLRMLGDGDYNAGDIAINNKYEYSVWNGAKLIEYFD